MQGLDLGIPMGVHINPFGFFLRKVFPTFFIVVGIQVASNWAFAR
jgi:hypothetical protein